MDSTASEVWAPAAAPPFLAVGRWAAANDFNGIRGPGVRLIGPSPPTPDTLNYGPSYHTDGMSILVSNA